MMTAKYKIKQSFISILTLMVFSTSIVLSEEYEATLTWSKKVELSTPVNGIVQKVFSQPGKIVASGEVLVQLDPRSFKADLKFSKANSKNTNEKNIEAKRELERQLDMYDRSMLSEHDLQVAKNNYTTAQSNHLQAQAALSKAKLNLEYSAIRSPFNAIVISSSAVKGQVVTSNMIPTILVVVAEAKRMVARLYVPINKLKSFVLGQGVAVAIAGQSYQGKILNISLEPSENGLYAVNIIFDSKDEVLRAGQKATVNL